MEGLSQKQIQMNKEEIIRLLYFVNRDGIETLIKWLEKRDYFVAPASTKYHLSCVGGLAQHSLNVYRNMMKLFYGDNWKTLNEYPTLSDDIGHENIIVVSLLHDLCKVDFYEVYSRNVKENGAWKEVQDYRVNEKMPIMGHGSKSVIVAQQFIKLFFPEIQAISFHMGNSDGDSSFSATISDVFGTERLALYTHLADIKSTFEDDNTCIYAPPEGESVDINDDDMPF